MEPFGVALALFAALVIVRRLLQRDSEQRKRREFRRSYPAAMEEIRRKVAEDPQYFVKRRAAGVYDQPIDDPDEEVKWDEFKRIRAAETEQLIAQTQVALKRAQAQQAAKVEPVTGGGHPHAQTERPGERATVIVVEFSAGTAQPGVIVDYATWPYARESFEKIEAWTGMPADVAQATLDEGRQIRNEWFRFWLRPVRD